MYVNYGILWDRYDDNTLAVIVEALILWGVTITKLINNYYITEKGIQKYIFIIKISFIDIL